jgi:hypothetical protein
MISTLVLTSFAVMYSALGLFCLAFPERSISAMGLSWQNTSGKIEFMTFYGGLELGLGIFFGICLWKKEWLPAALMLAFVSSLVLMITRGVSMLRFEDIGPLTYTFFYFEIAMVVVAALGVAKSS